MTRIDFYLLPDTEIHARYAFACRLIEKAYKLGHAIYVHTDSAAVTQELDELLWSYRPGSFLPHLPLTELQASIAADKRDQVPVNIGHGDDPGHHQDLLINLSVSRPDFFSRFERVSEVVVQEPRVLEATRENYKYYADRHYPIHRHDLRNKQRH